MKKPGKNIRVVMMLVAFVGVMIGLSYASVPLYRMLCAATGLGGTTQRATAAPQQQASRQVTVWFDSNVASGLPWDFTPEVRSMQVKLGEVMTAKYRARNRSDRPVVGTAVFNVQPSKAGIYFNKLECFCFTDQMLKQGQAIELPVQFFIDPALAEDRNAGDVADITLSYTFYPAKNQSKARAVKQASAAPTSNPQARGMQ